jgi:hypothetical protein
MLAVSSSKMNLEIIPSLVGGWNGECDSLVSQLLMAVLDGGNWR